jgi:magnesium transporter
VLGTGIALLAYFLDGDPLLGVVVLFAMWGNQIVAGFAGAFVPATLDRLGVDPSVASSVFVHTLTDLCGFFLLLGLASKLLLGQ